MGVTLGRADLELRGRLDAVPVTSRASDISSVWIFVDSMMTSLRIRAFVRYRTMLPLIIDRARREMPAAQLSGSQRRPVSELSVPCLANPSPLPSPRTFSAAVAAEQVAWCLVLAAEKDKISGEFRCDFGPLNESRLESLLQLAKPRPLARSPGAAGAPPCLITFRVYTWDTEEKRRKRAQDTCSHELLWQSPRRFQLERRCAQHAS